MLRPSSWGADSRARGIGWNGCRASDDGQCIRDGAFTAVARTIANGSCAPECCGSTAVEVHGFFTTEFGHVSAEFFQSHPNGQARLATVDLYEIEMRLVPANGASRVAFEHGTEFVRIGPGRLASRPSA